MICLSVQSFQLHVGRVLVPTNLSLRQITKAAGLVENDGAQSTGVLHSELESRVTLFLARVVTDNAVTKGSALVRVQMVTTELATSHTANHVDKVGPVKILEPVLVRIVSIGTAVEIVRRRIFTTLLVTCILRSSQHTCNEGLKRTYAITFFVEHEGGNGPSSICSVPGLATNTDSGSAPAVLVLGSGDGASGHQHDRVSGGSMGVEITEVVDGGTTSQWCSLYPFPVRTIAGPERTDHLVSSGSSPTPITEPHHFSVQRANGVTSALHTLSS